MSDKDTGRDILIGFLLGTAAGAAIGLLFAPKSGAETRAILKEKAEEVAERAKEIAAKAKEAAVNAEKNIEQRLVKKKIEE